MKNVLILGGQGFIGCNLTRKLLKEDFKIKIFEKYINENKKLPGCEYIQGDFQDIEKYPEIFEDVDVVYHLISTTIPNKDFAKIQFDIETNLIPTVKLLGLICEKNVKKIIYTSSGGTIYGEQKESLAKETSPNFPICAYGINKLAAEKYIHMFNKLYGIDYAILRLSNPYGKNHFSKSQGAINVFIDKILNNENIEIWGDGTVSRDYIYIDDVVEALFKAIDCNSEEKIFNISSGKATSINELLNLLKRISNKDFNVIYKSSRDFDVKINCLDNTLAKKCLNWEPKITLEDGIKSFFK